MKPEKRTKKSQWSIWLAGLMGLTTTYALAAEVGGKPEKTDVVVTYAQASGAFTPIWVANDAGLFKKYGLNAKLQLLNPQVSAQAVISEEADFYTDGPDLINARLHGGQVKYFGGTMQQLVFQIWGAKAIATVQDLKGKAMAASTPRAALDTATREALKRNGLIPDRDVQILYVQTVPAILSAIIGGKTAAGTLPGPAEFFKGVIPPNIFAAANNGDVLPLTVFALLWGTTGLGFSRGQFLEMQLFAILFFALFIPISARLAENGRRRFLICLKRPRNVRLENEQLVPGKTIESLLRNAEIF